MANVVTDFDITRITNMSIQFFKNGTQEPGTKFGCVGSIERETESKEVMKKCEGIEVKKLSKPMKSNLKITAHVPVGVLRDYFGLRTDGLKAGVWAYGTLSKGLDFVLTADEIDEFENVTKLVAYPNCSNAAGFGAKIENGADEVAELELEVTALPDESGEIYYEAFTNELTDQTVAEQWHTQFTRTLVEEVPVP